MSIRPDVWIRKMALEHGMIDPFVETQVRQREDRSVVSYGLSSFGYDIRVSRHFRIFTNVYGSVVDPKAFDARGLVEIESDVCLIPPNSFALALSVETFRIPDNVMTLCVGKSTYARCGIIVNVTPFEPGWEGQAVLEISNTTPLPAKVYADEGLAQVLFFESETPCQVSYAQRKGKYQHQSGITLPQV
jgi:dCTP deaminase